MELTKIYLALAAALFAAIWAGPSLPAQTNAAPATAPQADPFVKKDAPPMPVNQNSPVANIILTFQVYHVGQADGARLLQENTTDQRRYDGLLSLVKLGKARLEAVLSGAVESGEQCTVEQLDIVSYAMAFRMKATGTGAIAPCDFKQRSVGYRLVFKGQESRDQQGYDDALFLEHTALQQFLEVPQDFDGFAAPVPLPEFATERVNAKPPSFPYGKIRFMGTYNPAPPDIVPEKKAQPQQAQGPVAEPGMTLVFAEASRVQYQATALPEGNPAAIELGLTVYSMDRNAALAILSQSPQEDSVYQAVQALAGSGQAKLEHISVLRTLPGIKCNLDSVVEEPHAVYQDHVTQDVGWGIEANASFAGNRPLLDINVTKCQLLSDRGSLKVGGLAETMNASQPVFQIQSVVTRVNTALGKHVFLGTMSPPGDTGIGIKDTGRVWLAFLQATSANP